MNEFHKFSELWGITQEISLQDVAIPEMKLSLTDMAREQYPAAELVSFEARECGDSVTCEKHKVSRCIHCDEDYIFYRTIGKFSV